MKDQKSFRPPQTCNLEDRSLTASPANIQPQMSTAGAPYGRPWPYSPVARAQLKKPQFNKDSQPTATLDCKHGPHSRLPVIAVKGDIMQIKQLCVQCSCYCRVCLQPSCNSLLVPVSALSSDCTPRSSSHFYQAKSTLSGTCRSLLRTTYAVWIDATEAMTRHVDMHGNCATSPLAT